MIENTELSQLIEKLNIASSKLKEGELSHEQACELVNECAELANRSHQELEQLMRTNKPQIGNQGELI